jgi:hypothetical protein
MRIVGHSTVPFEPEVIVRGGNVLRQPILIVAFSVVPLVIVGTGREVGYTTEMHAIGSHV